MEKNKRARAAIPMRHKVLLILFGLFLALVILETGLRLGGFILLSIQEYRNVQAIKQKGTYRILCLGESNTADQYPVFLEEALNRSNIDTGVRFSVIDKGRVGADTSTILSEVESYLNKYRPDMVVTMMGINDWETHIPYEAAAASKTAFN